MNTKQKPMRSVWQSLLWKEWHEHKWKLVGLAAILFAVSATFVMDDVRSLYLGVRASLIGYGIIAGGFLGMSMAAGESTRGTMGLVRSLPAQMWQVAIVKLFVAIATVAVPVVAVVLAASAITNSNWIDPAIVEKIVAWEVPMFLYCWGITDWSTARIVWGVLGTCSLLLWMAAIGVNRSDEIRAGAIGFLVVVIVWLSFAYSLDRADRANLPRLEEGIRVLMAAAPGGPAFVEAEGDAWWGAYLPFLVSAVVGHGCVLFWYLRQYGRVASKPARFVNDSQTKLLSSTSTLPPFKSPFRAIAWKQFRETGPLVAAAAGLVLAMVVLYFTFGYDPFRWDEVGAILGGITVSVCFLVTMVAGIGVSFEDLKPGVNNFWRSRPVNLGLWFGVKFVTGWIVLVTTFGMLFLLAATMNSNMLPSSLGDQALVGFFFWLLTLIYTLAMGTYCLLRQPLYAAVITVGVLVGGGFVANLLFEGVRLPWLAVTALLLVTEMVALLVAWLAVRNDWGWHRS